MSRRPALSAAVALALGACTVGPTFAPPRAAAPPAWAPTPADVPSRTFGGEVDAQWWRTLGDPELDSLVSRLAAQNLDLQAAAERVEQGRAQSRAVAAQGLPQVDGQSRYTRTRASQNGFISLVEPAPGAPVEYDNWQEGFTASWELDLFGRVRRQVEAARADAEAEVEARHGIALMALSDLAQDYAQLRVTQAREAVARDNLAVVERNRRLVADRFAQGVASRLDVAGADAQRDQIASNLPDLETEEARLINAVGLLLAQPPRALEGELRPFRVSPPPPPRVPVGVPGDLVRRRPDVREAEARLHAATAQTGVAVADFYPDVTIRGDGGVNSLHLKTLFDAASGEFNIGPSVSIPIFEGGRLKATLRLRRSQQREAALAFQATVLRAWQEVDDALTGYAQTQRRRRDIASAVANDRIALDAARQRYAQGAVDFLNVTSAQGALLHDEDQLAAADGRTFTSLVNLYKALGGGWQVADAPSPGRS